MEHVGLASYLSKQCTTWAKAHETTFLCLTRQLSTGGILYSACQCVHVRRHACVIVHWKFVNTVSYKLLVAISPDLQLRCSYGHRWTVYILSSKGQGHNENKCTFLLEAYRLTVHRRPLSSFTVKYVSLVSHSSGLYIVIVDWFSRWVGHWYIPTDGVS